jgi:transcription elongation factor Elf1
MKIIKEGNLPVPTKRIYGGECFNCGCRFECEEKETIIGTNTSHRFLDRCCPTPNCGVPRILVSIVRLENE